MSNKLKPALLGGVIIGILSLIPFVSTCCCVWAILGGMLASFLYIKSSSVPVSTGDGAVVGLLAGVIGSVIYVVVQLFISLIFGMAQLAQMEEQFRRSGVEIPFTGIVLVLLIVCMVVVLLLIFSTIGGLIGVPIFEKRKGAPVPPPPPNY